MAPRHGGNGVPAEHGASKRDGVLSHNTIGIVVLLRRK